MNYYFDLDNTIYETAKLTDLMLCTIAKTVSENSSYDYEDLLKYVKENFNSTVDKSSPAPSCGMTSETLTETRGVPSLSTWTVAEREEITVPGALFEK